MASSARAALRAVRESKIAPSEGRRSLALAQKTRRQGLSPFSNGRSMGHWYFSASCAPPPFHNSRSGCRSGLALLWAPRSAGWDKFLVKGGFSAAGEGGTVVESVQECLDLLKVEAGKMILSR